MMIENFAYLILLVGALCCLAIIDNRFKLAIFSDGLRTIKVLLVAVVLFLIWDILGVSLGIFFTGETRYLTGLNVLPDIPIEELFFLLLLNYNALLLWRGGERLWPRM